MLENERRLTNRVLDRSYFRRTWSVFAGQVARYLSQLFAIASTFDERLNFFAALVANPQFNPAKASPNTAYCSSSIDTRRTRL